jgi:Fe(3+) dicitrate transport protein
VVAHPCSLALGGMLNYAEKTKRIYFETQNTVGSYGLMSSYNANGGTIKNSLTTIIREVLTVGEKTTSIQYETHMHLWNIALLIKQNSQHTNMNYDMQPGGLTDAQFDENPRQSVRSRNWFGTPWNVFSLNFDTKITSRLL